MSTNKKLLEPFIHTLYEGDVEGLSAVIDQLFEPTAKIQMAFPFETLPDLKAFHQIYADLFAAIPDGERRDLIVMEGPASSKDGLSDTNSDWVGCCCYYTGVMTQPWLDIPPTQQQVHMRFHEFYRFEAGKIVEVQSLWDIPELIKQAGVWPMGPSLGREWHVPGPATQDGLRIENEFPEQGAQSAQLVSDMLNGLSKHKSGGADAMGLESYWHPKMNWYGPAGIGTNRHISGFRRHHQIPFLNAMPDRGSNSEAPSYLFGEGEYVGFTAWPGMRMTLTGNGWLGIAPSDKAITMRSLDFWRCENGLIRENWVLVDLLHVWDQLGVDVLARMREISPSHSF